MRRASRAAMMQSSYLLVPGGGISEASFMRCSSSGTGAAGSRPFWMGSTLGGQSPHACALGVDDADEPAHRLLEIVVHHQIVILPILRQFSRRVAEPAFDRPAVVHPAAEQTLAKR